MPDRLFTFEERNLRLRCPETIDFENAFFETIYRYLFNEVTAHDYPLLCIDFDDFLAPTPSLNLIALAHEQGIPLPTVNSDKVRSIKSILAFLRRYPAFYNTIKNLNADAEVSIKAAEFLAEAETSAENFITIKKLIDQLNSGRWTRNKDTNERQAGVSTLGTISEKLLGIAMAEHIDQTNFFKNNNNEVQSYGDFVLMCLPNNLWMSVKSNYARERLLASGFTTDIVGVGFFTDYAEFTSVSKVRNFQKVGFLAMYVPDIPITDSQIASGDSTFSQIEHHYNTTQGISLPLNINGQPFIRRLSHLNRDIRQLLSVDDIKRRTIIGF